MPDRLTVGVVCTRGIGPARGGRSRNEDNYVVCRGREARFRHEREERVTGVKAIGTLVAVADGMGGHEDGDLASSAAVQALTRLFRKGQPENPERRLFDFVLDAHRRLREKASEMGPVQMGTTLTSCWFMEGRAYWCHVGDSRLYHWRRGVLRQLSRDHTWKEFAQRDGRPHSEADGRHLVQNFVFGSRGLGDDPMIRLDYGMDTGSMDLEPGDRFIVCSDGLSGFVPSHRIADVLQETLNPQGAATALVERALAAGSDDNVTVMVVRVEDSSLHDEGPHIEIIEEDDTLVPDDTLIPE